MKEFWNKISHDYVTDNQSNRDVNYFQKEIGLFFWERGGKQFVEEECESEFIIINNLAKSYLNPSEESYWDYSHLEDDSKRKAQNFLDCVACLGETKVKELISELKERSEI